MNVSKVLIVGGVAGGASAAARLRRLNEEVEIILFEKGEYISFANCGLPYYIGGEIKNRADLTLQTPAGFKRRFNIDVRTFNEVTAINKEEKYVTVINHKTNETYNESYDILLLSPGAEPIRPNLEGINLDRVFTLRNIPDTYRIKDYIDNASPKTAVVIGGGYIGVEMAENLRNAGLDVTIIEMQNQVIAPLDYDMACIIHNELERNGVTLKLETALEKIEENGSLLKVITNKGTIDTDMVILAIGVKPETKIAADAGIKLNSRGAFIVDEYMKTSDEFIYAAGDAVEVTDFITNEKSVIPLAGPANKQGRIAADNIAGIKSSYRGTQGSAILKVFNLTAASTGITEKKAKHLGLNYEKSFTVSGSHAGYYPGAAEMFIKTIFDKDTGKILGAQIVGEDGVDKRCDVIAAAINFKATVYDLTKLELCYAPPYSSAKDPVNMAGYVAENILKGIVKIFHYHDVSSLPKDGSVNLIDTRTRGEYRLGHIDGFINIPVDSLRERMNEIDKSKPVYIVCHVGLRGYLACRILEGYGYTCYNLSGGYALYREIIK
ncbi:MAG TPA: CoA-disulfide reductase [Candidatus Mucispirillum faecigallinarum]|uniref:CoA-disulfide reductase n=1 Tax=Candidatus Mucispirillum faecigallinarum TaxID=2838699 RepID=A0A9D2GTR2_9BACT|nr:CoA-disulfide reductase [Candidatus Mucispirillum faecigallinarum]